MATRGSAGNTSNASTGNITVAVSSIGIQNGDIVLLHVANLNNFTYTMTPPTGFNAVPGASPILNNSWGNQIFWKLASSEPTSYTVTGASAYSNIVCQVRVYYGRNQSSPFTSVSSTAQTIGSYPITLALTGLTAATGDDIVSFVNSTLGGSADTVSYTPASGYSNSLVTQDTVDGYFSTICGADYDNHAGGATGTIGGTLSDTAGATDQGYCAFVLSLAEATNTIAWWT